MLALSKRSEEEDDSEEDVTEDIRDDDSGEEDSSSGSSGDEASSSDGEEDESQQDERSWARPTARRSSPTAPGTQLHRSPSSASPRGPRQQATKSKSSSSSRGKRKRIAVASACTPCRQGKLACDDGDPCQQCARRNRAHLCERRGKETPPKRKKTKKKQTRDKTSGGAARNSQKSSVAGPSPKSPKRKVHKSPSVSSHSSPNATSADELLVGGSTGSGKGRTVKVACARCRAGKIACDNNNPCQNCEKKGYDCIRKSRSAAATPGTSPWQKAVVSTTTFSKPKSSSSRRAPASSAAYTATAAATAAAPVTIREAPQSVTHAPHSSSSVAAPSPKSMSRADRSSNTSANLLDSLISPLASPSEEARALPQPHGDQFGGMARPVVARPSPVDVGTRVHLRSSSSSVLDDGSGRIRFGSPALQDRDLVDYGTNPRRSVSQDRMVPAETKGNIDEEALASFVLRCTPFVVNWGQYLLRVAEPGHGTIMDFVAEAILGHGILDAERKLRALGGMQGPGERRRAVRTTLEFLQNVERHIGDGRRWEREIATSTMTAPPYAHFKLVDVNLVAINNDKSLLDLNLQHHIASAYGPAFTRQKLLLELQPHPMWIEPVYPTMWAFPFIVNSAFAVAVGISRDMLMLQLSKPYGLSDLMAESAHVYHGCVAEAVAKQRTQVKIPGIKLFCSHTTTFQSYIAHLHIHYTVRGAKNAPIFFVVQLHPAASASHEQLQ